MVQHYVCLVRWLYLLHSLVFEWNLYILKILYTDLGHWVTTLSHDRLVEATELVFDCCTDPLFVQNISSCCSC